MSAARSFHLLPVPVSEYRRPVEFMPPMSAAWLPQWGECKPARFAVQVIRRGHAVQVMRPNLAREDREAVRATIADMRRDAKRWGDTLRIARVIETR